MSFFTQENQTLYLTTWGCNAALILEELKKIITDNGGRVKDQTPGYIVNRSISGLINEAEKKIETAKNHLKMGLGNPDSINAFISNTEKDINEMRAIDNSPIRVSSLTYISFVLDNQYYYLQFDSNPFFEFYYQKTPINAAGVYSLDACLEALNKDWLWDCFFNTVKKRATRDDIREAANIIFNDLVKARDSYIRIDGHKTRVPNTYNSGYHYEFIKDKERTKKIDF